MSTFNLRRLASPAALNAIQSRNLHALVGPHHAYLGSRRISLPNPESHSLSCLSSIADLLAEPDERMPSRLANAFFLIEELSTEEAPCSRSSRAASSSSATRRRSTS